MASLTLIAGITLDLLTAAFSVYVASRVIEANRFGLDLQATLWFWYGLAGFMLLDGGYALAVMRFDPQPPIPLVVLMARRLFILAGLAGLTSYLLNMGTIRRRGWVVAYYGVWATLVEAQTLYQNPQGHVADVWSIQFVYTQDTPALFNFAEGVALFGPLIIAALIAMRQYRMQPRREQRFRLAMLVTSVLSFCIGIIVGFWDNEWFWYGLFENRLGFTIAAGMLFALRPPWIVRKLWKIPRVKAVEQWPV